MAKKGYVAASIDYRLAQPGCAPPSSKCGQAIVDATHDAQAAVRFFRRYASTYGVDPSRIAMAGTSAGAIIALLVGYQSNDPGTSGNPGFSSAVSAAVSLSGAALFNGSIDASDPPALDFHGTADPLVPYAWTQATADAAKAAGVEYNLVTWQGDGHVPYLEHRNQILDLSANFLYRKLDLAHAATS
jgi:acetyl esterase/lipase